MFIEYPKNMTPQEIFNSIEQILQDLLSIESKGYLNTIDLKQFPVINQFIAILTDSPEFINGFRSMESYKWIYNLLLINLYELSTTLLKNTESEIETDFYNDLLFLNKSKLASMVSTIESIKGHVLRIYVNIKNMKKSRNLSSKKLSTKKKV